MWPHTTTTLPSISRLPGTPRDATPDNWNLGWRTARTDSGRRTARQHWRNPDLSGSQDQDMMRMAYERTAYTFFEGMKGEFVKETEALKEQYEANTAMQIMTLQDQILALKRQIIERHGHTGRAAGDAAADEIQAVNLASSGQLGRLLDPRVALSEGAQTQPAGLQDQLVPLRRSADGQAQPAGLQGQLVPLRRRADDQEEASAARVRDDVLELRRQVRALQERGLNRHGQVAGLQDELKKICASEVRKALESFLGGPQLRQQVKHMLHSELQAPLERKIGDVARRVDAQDQSTDALMERVAALESQAPHHRVGTADAQSWLARAREQLDEFGRSLKDSDTKAGNPTAEALLESMAKARAELGSTYVVCHSPVEEVPPWGQRPSGPDRPPLPVNMTPDFGEWGGGCGRRRNGRGRGGDAFDEGLSSPGEEVVDSLHQATLFDDGGASDLELLQAHAQDGLPHWPEDDDLCARARGVLEELMLDEEEQGDGQEEEDELRAKARGFLDAWAFDGDEPDDGTPEEPEEDELRARARGLMEALLLDGDEAWAFDGDEPGDGKPDEDDLRGKARDLMEALLLDGDVDDGDLAARAREHLEAWVFDDGLREKARGLMEALLLEGDVDDGGGKDGDLTARAREHLEDLLLDNDGGN